MHRIQKVLYSKGPRGKLGIDTQIECTENILHTATSEETEAENKPNSLDDNAILIRPNPVVNAFLLQLQLKDKQAIDHCSIGIYSVSGQLVYEIPKASPQSEFNINVQNWIPGVYMVRVYLGNDSYSKKVIVQ